MMLVNDVEGGNGLDRVWNMCNHVIVLLLS